jgi:hypothetical protein
MSYLLIQRLRDHETGCYLLKSQTLKAVANQKPQIQRLTSPGSLPLQRNLSSRRACLRLLEAIILSNPSLNSPSINNHSPRTRLVNNHSLRNHAFNSHPSNDHFLNDHLNQKKLPRLKACISQILQTQRAMPLLEKHGRTQRQSMSVEQWSTHGRSPKSNRPNGTQMLI